ncbi:MAG: hypothetical protein HYX43_05030 [Burkholderiales bacterium]|nr:hypothetical protein [Burkholderiales bacterium]
MRHRTRKRSRAVTLVLAGSATLAGCGAPVEQRDAYASLADCVKDWNNAAQCEPARDNRYASNYFYGPRYYGASFPDGRPRPSANAMDAAYIATALSPSSASRSWFGSRSGSWFSSSSSHSSGSTSRGGFGSTGRSMSSSGS